ncbi:MAG: NADH:flavin oxidoreductase [Thermodesulfobacteriota bacterium]
MKLFEPLIINGMTLKNRIVMAPMQLQLGLTNRRARAFYLARAKGGVGAIIMCGTSVDFFIEDSVWGRPNGVALFVERMRSFTDEIRQTGAKIGIQLWHGNQWPAGTGETIPGAEQVAPSAKDDRRALTIAEIERIIGKFAQAAGTAQSAGFDFVEIHGAHGYLVCQFFSGADNQRTDRYGGDLEGRMRFGLATVEAMRQTVGEKFPIIYRLGAQEKRPGGITLRQSRAFAKQLQKAGVDAFDISIGSPEGSKAMNASPGPKAKMGTYVPLAEAIKKEVTVPVMAVGRINRPEVAEAILTEGRADWIGIGRQLIADPQWTIKVSEGRSQEIVACKSCNTCFQPMLGTRWKFGDPICKVNPEAGREVDLA